jgi:hypothetical protein
MRHTDSGYACGVLDSCSHLVPHDKEMNLLPAMVLLFCMNMVEAVEWQGHREGVEKMRTSFSVVAYNSS